MSRPIDAGSVDQSTIIRILDATTFLPETAVTSATAGLALQYRREGAAAVALTESDLLSVDSAHADGGLIHIGDGYYRVDLPDAAVSAGAPGVLVFGAVTGMVIQGAYHQLRATAEPTSAPGATAGQDEKLNWLFALSRNKKTQTSTTQTLYADDGTTVIATGTHSVAAGTYTSGEFS